MNIYYKVVSRFYDNGDVEVEPIQEIKAMNVPKDTVIIGNGYDEYIDYFDSEEMAQMFKSDLLEVSDK